MGHQLYRHIRQDIANEGLGKVLFKIGRQLPRIVWLQLRRRGDDANSAGGEAQLVHPFDIAYSVDTSGLIWGGDIPTRHPNGLWSTAYYGTPPSVFNQMVDELEARLKPEWGSFTFLDLGCGKGRAMMLASRLPFRKIIGVELSPELTRVAQQNFAAFCAPWQRCLNLEAQEGDATSVDLPQSPLMVYLYNPFAKPVLEGFLRHLEKSLKANPREVLLLYFNPSLEEVVARRETFAREFLATFPMEAEDMAADCFHSERASVAVYRYVPQARPVVNKPPF